MPGAPFGSDARAPNVSRIRDDHRASRSARTASAADSANSTGVRNSSRARIDGDALIREALPDDIGHHRMAGHVDAGSVKSFAIWNPIDLGYSAIYLAHDLAVKQLERMFDLGRVAGRGQPSDQPDHRVQ